MAKLPTTRLTARSGWKLTRSATPRAVRRGGTAGSGLLAALEATGRVTLDSQYVAERPARRGAADEPLVLELVAPNSNYVLAAQHESGVVTFHPALQSIERRGSARRGRRGTGPVTLKFRVPVRGAGAGSARRGGIVSKIVKLVVVKVLGKAGDWALVKLAQLWETRAWKQRSLGLVQVDPTILALGGAGRFEPVTNASRIAPAPARNLLFIHGTFSHAEATFAGLAKTAGTDGRHFFDSVDDLYGGRIFAFNHFTVSESPEQNARALLKALPARGGVFDVITHSRGALVLRTLVELRDQLGPEAARFTLNRAVLCMGPNEGTPLADGDRWDTLTQWIGNLTDFLPENPFTFAIDFVAESLGWLAQGAAEKLPGLASMNPGGDVVAALQGDPNPPANAYWAIAANHEPDDGLLRRATDFGIDTFFGRSNDMVVPTSGSWRVDPSAAPTITASQIACFGQGGNVHPPGGSGVHHCNLFQQPETVDLLLRVLRGDALGISPLDPATEPSSGGLIRRGGAAPIRVSQVMAAVAAQPVISPAVPPLRRAEEMIEAAGVARPVPAMQVVTTVDSRGRAASFLAPVEPPADDNFNLFLAEIDSTTGDEVDYRQYFLLASYRNARVLVEFRAKGDENGIRWRRIIETREKLVGYIDGDPTYPALPDNAELHRLGRDLFDVLFPGDVRRLYDHARAEFARPVGAQVAERRLSIIFTSMVPWVADKPLEFAYDPARRALLAAQDVNFVRNVITAVPAEARLPRQDKLRILVVAAQPVGAASLSVDEEIAVITRGFQPLIDAQLADVEVVPSVTPEKLHELMQSSAYGNDPIDILHFIGHGEYVREGTEKQKKGYLLFEADNGGIQRVDAEVITQIVARRGIRLVFLNACETGTGYSGAHDFTNGVAPELVAAGVPAVVANQFPVLDPSATAFARHFYWSLAQGRSIGDAAREARVAVNYSITGEAIDWAVPVVFARNPYERIVIAPGTTSLTPMADAARTAVRQTRRRGTRRGIPIAIWDVNYVVPGLEGLIRRMNSAQSVFSFELADITAPIGTWRRVKTESTRGSRGRTNVAGRLKAEEVFAKLRGVPAQLGVQQLICLTNFSLSDEGQDVIDGIYNPELRISIVSTAGYLEIDMPPGASINRLVINQTVAYINPVSEHLKGVKKCPNYRNDEHNLEILAGPIALCARCRKLVVKLQDAQSADAIDALLNLEF
jgi:hypothetical protein